MAKTETPHAIRLLVVSEDDAVNHAVDRLCESYSEDRYLVQRVGKPADVNAVADDEPFDAVLLDLKPELQSGTAQAESVVMSMVGHGPVIALTGLLDRAAEQSLQRAGAADCLFNNETAPRGLRRSIRYVIASSGTGPKTSLQRLFDPSTGLATQFLFWEILGLAARRSKRNKDFFALLLLEIAELPAPGADNVGNLVMQIAAERTSSVLRASDTVARFEHHQLAILVESMPRVDGIQIVAEKIVQELGKPFPIGDTQRDFPVNLGISLYPTSSENADTLIGKAFEALGTAKERGKDEFVFA